MTSAVCKTLLALVLLLVALPATAQLDSLAGNVTLSDFTLTGEDDSGQQWRLAGERTAPVGHIIAIDGLTLDFQLRRTQNGKLKELLGSQDGNVTVRLQSTHCALDWLSREIKSNDPLSMSIGRNIRISGIGYDVDIQRRVVLLRSTVTLSMRSQRRTLQLFNRNKEPQR